MPVYTECECLRRPEEDAGSPGAGVAGGWAMLRVGAWNGTLGSYHWAISSISVFVPFISIKMMTKRALKTDGYAEIIFCCRNSRITQSTQGRVKWLSSQSECGEKAVIPYIHSLALGACRAQELTAKSLNLVSTWISVQSWYIQWVSVTYSKSNRQDNFLLVTQGSNYTIIKYFHDFL